ncbi:MAG TPA: hypothetical protein VM734_09520 [Kofleriaceae bacterium]|jgi:hypothetical protein|nr:hypothetical protein [Kofleriaceae bacterium]
MKRTGVALSLMLAIGAPAVPAALAQPDAPEGTPKREGEYGGVSPDAGPGEAKGKKVKAPPKQTLTWIGFTAKEGGASELFFQAAQGFGVQQRVEGGTLVVVLEGLPRQARNTRRPLDTRFFDTAIAGVTAKPVRATRARKGKPAHPAGIEVRIAFKDPNDAKVASLRVETGTDGMSYAYLGFGPPSRPQQVPASAGGGTLSEPE